MISWLCGLKEGEKVRVETLLTYLGVSIAPSGQFDQRPTFIIFGSDIDQIHLEVDLPVISLNPDANIFGEGQAWLLPLPWTQETLQPIFQEIRQAQRLPKPYALDLNLHVRHLESLLIRQALVSANGVVSKAAASLQIQRTTLIEKMRRYKIDKSQF